MDTQERLEALERKCNRMRASQMALVGVLAAVFLVGAAQKDSDKVLRAGKLEIVNSEGVTVAYLGTGFGYGLLTLSTADGVRVLAATAEVTHGGLATYNHKGRELVRIGSAAHGGVVTTYDGKRTKMLSLGVLETGEPSIAAFNRSGNPEYSWPRRP